MESIRLKTIFWSRSLNNENFEIRLKSSFA
nr:MAG TPA: hypothetical protein [Caudoviricetes sp.]